MDAAMRTRQKLCLTLLLTAFVASGVLAIYFHMRGNITNTVSNKSGRTAMRHKCACI